MKASEYNKLLNEALAPLGLTVKLVTESQYMPKTGVIFTPRGKRRSVTPPPPYSNGKPSLRRDDTGQEICWCGHLRSHHQGGGCSYCRSEGKYGPHWYGESHLPKDKK